MQTIFDELIRLALKEDLLPNGDLTSELVFDSLPEDKKSKLAVFSRNEPGIFSGTEFVKRVFTYLDAKSELEIKFFFKDGEKFSSKEKLLEITGSPKTILQGERLFLNLLQRAISIATLTGQFVRKISHTNAKLLDTRKTTPGLRELEKQAVLDGGGFNHRFNLSTGILIKDNHISLAGGLKNLLARLFSPEKEREQRKLPHLIALSIEVDSWQQFEEVLKYRKFFRVILLDNFELKELEKASKTKAALSGSFFLEASGGVRLENIQQIAETGVDFISVGNLTQSPKIIDLGLDFL